MGKKPPLVKAGIRLLMAKSSAGASTSSKSLACKSAGNCLWYQAAAVKYGKFKADETGPPVRKVL